MWLSALLMIKRLEKSLVHIEGETRKFLSLVPDRSIALNDSSVVGVDGDTEREIVRNGYTLARRMASSATGFGTSYVRWNAVPPRNGIFYSKVYPDEIFRDLTQSLRKLPAFDVATFSAPTGNLRL